MPTQKRILIDPNAESPYDLPVRLVEAQDPGLGDLDLGGITDMGDDAAGGDAAPAPEGDAPATPPEGPSQEEMLEQIEKSPPSEWEKYLQPILKDIKNTIKVPIELHNNYTVPVADDPDLGFHITGIVHFLEGIPEEYAVELGDSQLRYVAYVGPDGLLSRDIDLIYPTSKPPYKPTYHHNPNVY